MSTSPPSLIDNRPPIVGQMKSQYTGNSESLLAERIADDVWELWRISRATAHPVKSGRITPEKYWILRLLYKSGAHRIKDIASKLGTTSSPVTISVKKLEAENLVSRNRGSDDERVVMVDLTKHGRQQFELWRRERIDALAHLFNSLTQEEKKVLHTLLRKAVGIGTESAPPG